MLYRLALSLLVLQLLPHGQVRSVEADTDWERLGAEARTRGLPVVLLVTDHACGYCERLRREFLASGESRSLLDSAAVTGELLRSSGGKTTDFDGERIRTRVLLSRYQVFATPTLLFLSPSGHPLAPPLVGYNDPDTYARLVSQRLAQAEASLNADEPLH